MRAIYILALVDTAFIPSLETAVQQYHSWVAVLHCCSPFGSDPLDSDENLVTLQNRHMQANIPNFDTVFHKLVNGNDKHFRDGLKVKKEERFCLSAKYLILVLIEQAMG